MKNLLFVVVGLVMVSSLVPSSGFAQWQNELGIYTEEMDVNQTATPLSTHMVYIVITNPYNEYDDDAVTRIHGYECSVTLDGPGDILSLEWPVWALNVGTYENQIVAFGHEDIQVHDDAAVLAFMEIYYSGSGTEPLTLTLGPTTPASFAGQMAYLDYGNNHTTQLLPMTTVSGDWSSPVFGFNADPEVVATEQTSFDSLKALYR